jgi:hypothetical protein
MSLLLGCSATSTITSLETPISSAQTLLTCQTVKTLHTPVLFLLGHRCRVQTQVSLFTTQEAATSLSQALLAPHAPLIIITKLLRRQLETQHSILQLNFCMDLPRWTVSWDKTMFV